MVYEINKFEEMSKRSTRTWKMAKKIPKITTNRQKGQFVQLWRKRIKERRVLGRWNLDLNLHNDSSKRITVIYFLTIIWWFTHDNFEWTAVRFYIGLMAVPWGTTIIPLFPHYFIHITMVPKVNRRYLVPLQFKFFVV